VPVRKIPQRQLERWIARALPRIVRRSLKTSLRGVWLQGRLGEGAHVVAANHHSWWDGYLLWLLLRPRPFTLIMDDEGLGRFPFFRRHGLIGCGEVREALRRLERGATLAVFPEGKLRPPGKVSGLHEGAAFFAKAIGVPLVPLAVRVTMRGSQLPEAYLSLGPPLDSARLAREALTEELAGALNGLLHELDDKVLEHDPEAPLPGFELLLPGRGSTHERVAWLERLWRS
jgi:1-acyl-sn-glycerol-3-phosphate acyltransferase